MLEHFEKARQIQGNYLARTTRNNIAVAQLFAKGLDAQDWHELFRINQAAWQQLGDLQSDWARDWRAWLDFAGSLKGANTMSKFVEREGNIFAQAVSQLGAQATDFAGLLENIDVDYGYWLQEKLAAKDAAKTEPAR
jgi:hypothetical protein